MADNVAVRGGTRPVQWGKGVLAGILSMLVFALVEMAFSWALRGRSPWHPLDIFGAITLGQNASGAVHTGTTTLVGALALLALGVLAGVIVALLVHRSNPPLALALGALFGLAMYYVDLYGFARIFPSLAELRDWMSAVAYAVQGGLAAGLYKAMSRSMVDVVPEHAGRDMRRMREVQLL
jgi:hypothetical protein